MVDLMYDVTLSTFHTASPVLSPESSVAAFHGIPSTAPSPPPSLSLNSRSNFVL